MRLNWKTLHLAMFVALALVSGGCGGINASHTVSPASFFLPGLMRNDAGPNPPTAFPTNSPQFASVK